MYSSHFHLLNFIYKFTVMKSIFFHTNGLYTSKPFRTMYKWGKQIRKKNYVSNINYEKRSKTFKML